MKPLEGQNIEKRNVASLHGSDVEPLSKLAAASEAQRAEHFRFTEADKTLLAAVLAEDNDT
jgi:hypothetical protein